MRQSSIPLQGLCRRTRQVVSFYIGRHDNSSCKQLWQGLSPDYASCACASALGVSRAEPCPSRKSMSIIIDRMTLWYIIEYNREVASLTK